MSNTILDNRAMSGFPLSIGTGLALETIFSPIKAVYDEAREAPPKADLSRYTDHLINVSTLLRNLISTLKYDELLKLTSSAVFDCLLEEIDFLQNFYQMHGIPLKFYVHSYQYPKSTYPDKLRLASSDHQKHVAEVTDYCLSRIKKEDNTLHFTKNLSISKDSSCLVLTHVPWDLLSYDNFNNLELLESHTGVIKTRKDWNTKYFKLQEKDMSFLPFMEYLLVTFGDNVMFKPAPLKERVALYETLQKKRVHPLMSELSISFMMR